MNNATTLDEKYRIAKSINVDLEKISGEGLDYIYDNKITKFLDPKDKMSKLRSHIYEPILSRDPDVIDRTHIDGYLAPQQQDERISAYVDRLDQSYELSLSYEKNLEKHLQANDIEIPVVGRIWQAVEGEK